MIIFENHLTSPSYGWYSPIPHWAKADISMPAPGHTQLPGEWLFYHLVVVEKKKKHRKLLPGRSMVLYLGHTISH